MNTDFDLRSVKLTGRAKKLVTELDDYAARMRELGRTPVYRVKQDDYIELRAFSVKHLVDKQTLGRVLLSGHEIVGRLG